MLSTIHPAPYTLNPVAADRYGRAVFEVVLSFASIEECSRPTTFAIEILPVNDAPTFELALGEEVVVLEDEAALEPWTLRSFLSSVVAEPFERGSEQVVTFHVTPLGTDAEQLFAVLPSVSPDGDLAFMTRADANGVAAFRLSASDDGGASSPPVDFRIQVLPVNDAPSFRVAHQILTVREDEFSSAPFSRPGALTHVSPGPADEAGQLLSFRVSTDGEGRALFAEQPAVDAAGIAIRHIIMIYNI